MGNGVYAGIMKLRNIWLIFTILIGILMVIINVQVQDSSYNTVDVTKLNERYQQIENGIINGESTEYLQERYDCEIILKSDPDYDSKVMSAIKNSKILMDYESGNVLMAKIVFSGEGDLFDALRLQVKTHMLQVCIFILILGYLFIGALYYYYVRPFKKMEHFAADVAKGNLEIPLSITKASYFGAFTESFDIMREELKRARKRELEANVSKKELVAELSHDMKTPIATIKATCEVLKAKTMKHGGAQEYKDAQEHGGAQKYGSAQEEKDLLEKVSVIEQKADMIDQLIGNMFHATLEELENLKVETQEKPSTQIMDMFNELKYYETIEVKGSVPECLLYMDTLRLKQVIDNVVNNSYKYAKTKIEVSFLEQKEGIIVEIRDSGSGVPEEELALVTQKYYRGMNAKGKNGAGLGLFLAKYFMDNMKGGLECFNSDGFVVHLFLRKV